MRWRTMVIACALALFGSNDPSATAAPIAKCRSDIVDGVEVDYCVGNSSTTVADVPGVNVGVEFGAGLGFGG